MLEKNTSTEPNDSMKKDVWYPSISNYKTVQYPLRQLEILKVETL